MARRICRSRIHHVAAGTPWGKRRAGVKCSVTSPGEAGIPRAYLPGLAASRSAEAPVLVDVERLRRGPQRSKIRLGGVRPARLWPAQRLRQGMAGRSNEMRLTEACALGGSQVDGASVASQVARSVGLAKAAMASATCTDSDVDVVTVRVWRRNALP